MPNNFTNLNQDKSSTNNTSNNQIKTTDVNILLNRVRLDEKKTFKKKIIVSFLLIGLIISTAISLII
ncbi:hypothetical protein OA845_02195 [Candidatus Pelagibacter sp.]|nr:hypothetical protein [Candidatus Pelagibacter sp.]